MTKFVELPFLQLGENTCAPSHQDRFIIWLGLVKQDKSNTTYHGA